MEHTNRVSYCCIRAAELIKDDNLDRSSAFELANKEWKKEILTKVA